MKVCLATDHAGFELKEAVKNWLTEHDFDVEDCGAFTEDPADDYPEFIQKAAKLVSENPDTTKAIIFGGSGQGEAIVADKFPNVRAVVCYDANPEIIKLSREHNDANVLSLGARFLTSEQAIELVDLWLATPFSGEARHERRIDEITQIEKSLK